MPTLVNRAKVSTGTTGTGTITLGSAVAGFQTFAAAGVSNGDTVRYVIEDGTSWEIGTGTYSSTGPTLTRTVSESSAGGSALNLSGSAEVFISATSADTDNWNTAYGWGDHSTEGYLTGNQTITLSGDVSGSGTTAISVTVADDSHNHVISNVDGLQTALDSKQAAATALTTSTTFGGDVSGTYNSIVVADDSHNHVISNVDGLQAALDAKLDDSQKGAANGLAELDGSGKVPSSQLPSYVDDVLEYANSGSFPGTGETGKIYIALDTNDVYRWTGSAYVKVSDAVSTADQANTLATARTISLTGDVSGSTSFDGSANVSITATVADDSHNHVISNVDGLQTALDSKQAAATALTTSTTFGGDVSGTYNSIVVADDSHNHIISNVDGLQTALDGKLSTSGKAADSNLLDGLDSSKFLRSDTSDTFAGVITGDTIELNGGVTFDPAVGGAGSDTATDVGLALTTGTRIVGTNDGYIRTLLEWNSGSDIEIGQSGTSLIGGINLIPGVSGTVKIAGSRVFADNYHPNADKWTTARTLSLTGDVTGSVSWDGSGNASLTATVADDSHNHVISNVDGLQTALDGKLSLSGGTLTGGLNVTGSSNITIGVFGTTDTGSLILTGSTASKQATLRCTNGNLHIDAEASNATYLNYFEGTAGVAFGTGSGGVAAWMGADGDLWKGSSDNSGSRYFHDGYHPNADKWTTARTLSLTGDVTGSVSWDGSGNASLTATVVDDSHTHDGRYYTEDEIDGLFTAKINNLTSTTTAALLTELDGLDMFDAKVSGLKTSWWYAGNGDLSDAGRLTELAGTAQLWWTDNSGVGSARGNVTGLVIAPNTGGSAGKVFIYNDQGSGYSPGWREVWTNASDGSGSGLDADLLDGVQGSQFLRSDADDTFTGANLTVNNTLNVRGAIDLADNDILRLGSSDDWEFFHDGTHNYMDCNVGDLYIRQGTTSRYLFDVSSGDFHADGNIIAYSTSVSDARLKEDVAVLESPLEIIDQLRGVTFTRIDEQQKSSGVIAQELEKVMPWAIREHKARALKDDDTLYKTVEYDALSALFIESIKELKAEVLELKRQLAEKD